MNEAPPQVLIGARNGFNFDIPILLAGCLRSDLGIDVLEKLFIVDALRVLRMPDAGSTGGMHEAAVLAHASQCCYGMLA